MVESELSVRLGNCSMQKIIDNRCLVCGEELEFHGTQWGGDGDPICDGPDQATCDECGAEYQEDELICKDWIDSVPDLEKLQTEYKAWKLNAADKTKDVQDLIKDYFKPEMKPLVVDGEFQGMVKK